MKAYVDEMGLVCWYNYTDMIKRLVNESAFVSTVEYYDKCMNHGGTDRKWKYDAETEKYYLE